MKNLATFFSAKHITQIILVIFATNFLQFSTIAATPHLLDPVHSDWEKPRHPERSEGTQTDTTSAVVIPSAARGGNPVIPSAARELASEGTLPIEQENITFRSVQEAVENNETLNQLLFGLHPYLTISAEGVGTGFHEPSLHAYCYDSIYKLYEENDLYSEVKVLHIYIDNPNYAEIDLAQLQNFENLEYIVISFTYDACGNMSDSCLLTRTQNIIKAGDKSVTVLYQLSIIQ